MKAKTYKHLMHASAARVKRLQEENQQMSCEECERITRLALQEMHGFVDEEEVQRIVEEAGQPGDDFPYTFYKSDRESAKSPTHVEYPLTLEYIQRLETIARAAHLYWAVTDDTLPGQREQASTLYDALATVNFLDEDL